MPSRPLALCGAILLVLAALPALSGCGKKGAPQPPLRILPEPIEDLRARQVGQRILLSLERPMSRTDGTPLPESVELEILMTLREPVPRNAREVLAAPTLQWVVPYAQWDEYARGRRMEVGLRLISIASALDLPGGVAALSGRTLSFVAGVLEQGRRRSPMEKVTVLKVCDPPLAPVAVSVRAEEPGIQVAWQPPADGPPPAGYHVYRQAEAEGRGPDVALTTRPVKEPPFLDTGYRPGVPSRYVVRAIAAQDACESAGVTSEPVAWTDRFAPAAPEGLAAVEEAGTIRLFWRPSREPDLLGYRVYRGEGPGGRLDLLTPEPIPATTYTDTSSSAGIVYSYAVTAVDQQNNESSHSERATDQVEEQTP